MCVRIFGLIYFFLECVLNPVFGLSSSSSSSSNSRSNGSNNSSSKTGSSSSCLIGSTWGGLGWSGMGFTFDFLLFWFCFCSNSTVVSGLGWVGLS